MLTATTEKHGAELHFVRPDGVYRTSVLQAIPGYQPVSNAMEVAARFTAAPYFATALSGLGADALPWWQQLKIRIQAWAAQRQAKRVQSMLMRLAALAPPGSMQPSTPGVAALPPAQGTGGYGQGPTEQMANVGMQITAGIVKSGDDINQPSVVAPELPTAQGIAPNVANVPADLAAMIHGLVPNQVSSAAITSAMNRWYKLRQRQLGGRW
jgi:hypothetical protein